MQEHSNDAPGPCTADGRRGILRYMLDGSTHAAAVMPWGQFGPIVWPELPANRDRLIDAHLLGEPADVQFAPIGKPTRRVRLHAVQLSAYLPRADGLCSFLALDLDASSHGAGGLADPDAAARCFAERADCFGLLSGALIVRSRSGVGRHVFVFPPHAVPQADATLAVAFLAAVAHRIADRDADEYDARHAFRTEAGGIARPGQAGAVELFPRTTEKPERGYAIALPFGGTAARGGGGVPLDVFEHPPKPVQLDAVPRCDVCAWQRFVSEARQELERRTKRRPDRTMRSWRPRREPARLDPRTEALLAGMLAQGGRNRAVYYGWGDLIRTGVTEGEAERLLVDAAERCGLLRREALATVRSAQRGRRACS
ncbi:MAG: hypothetical protein ABII12_05255 [Planctomycetota bacterium]